MKRDTMNVDHASEANKCLTQCSLPQKEFLEHNCVLIESTKTILFGFESDHCFTLATN